MPLVLRPCRPPPSPSPVAPHWLISALFPAPVGWLALPAPNFPPSGALLLCCESLVMTAPWLAVFACRTRALPDRKSVV